MRKYEIHSNYVIEIDTKDHTLESLQNFIYENSIDYIVRTDDLKWDTLCFCFKQKF